MPITNIFKKKKIKEVEKKVKKEKLPEPVKPEVKKELEILEIQRILRAPQVTEKTTDLAKKNQYIFKVYSGVNKTEIKKAIEDLYKVEVLSLKIINMPRKRRRLGRILGWRKGYKKAIVRIKAGQKIEILPH